MSESVTPTEEFVLGRLSADLDTAPDGELPSDAVEAALSVLRDEALSDAERVTLETAELDSSRDAVARLVGTRIATALAAGARAAGARDRELARQRGVLPGVDYRRGKGRAVLGAGGGVGDADARVTATRGDRIVATTTHSLE